MEYNWSEIEALLNQLRGTEQHFGGTLQPLRSADENYATNIPGFERVAAEFSEALGALSKAEDNVQSSLLEIKREIGALESAARGSLSSSFQQTLGEWQRGVNQLEQSFGQTKGVTDTLLNEVQDLLKRTSTVHNDLATLQGQLQTAQSTLQSKVDAFDKGSQLIHDADERASRGVGGA